MTLRFHGNDVEYGDAVRQYFVEAEQQVIPPFLLDVHVEEERLAWTWSVGAATSDDKYGSFKDLRKRKLYYALDVQYAQVAASAPAIISGRCS